MTSTEYDPTNENLHSNTTSDETAEKEQLRPSISVTSLNDDEPNPENTAMMTRTEPDTKDTSSASQEESSILPRSFSKALGASCSSTTSLREIREKANQKLVKMRDRAIPITKKQKRSRYMPGKRYMPLLWLQWLWHPIAVLLGNKRDKFDQHDHHHHHHHHHHNHHGHDGERNVNPMVIHGSHHDDDFLLID